MNQEEETRRRLEQTSTRPMGGTASKHEHRYLVTTSNMTVIRWCVSCGKSWRMVAIQRNFQQRLGWQEIFETE